MHIINDDDDSFDNNDDHNDIFYMLVDAELSINGAVD